MSTESTREAHWSFSVEIFNLIYAGLGSNRYLLYFLRTGVAVLKRFL